MRRYQTQKKSHNNPTYTLLIHSFPFPIPSPQRVRSVCLNRCLLLARSPLGGHTPLAACSLFHAFTSLTYIHISPQSPPPPTDLPQRKKKKKYTKSMPPPNLHYIPQPTSPRYAMLCLNPTNIRNEQNGVKKRNQGMGIPHPVQFTSKIVLYLTNTITSHARCERAVTKREGNKQLAPDIISTDRYMDDDDGPPPPRRSIQKRSMELTCMHANKERKYIYHGLFPGARIERSDDRAPLSRRGERSGYLLSCSSCRCR